MVGVFFICFSALFLCVTEAQKYNGPLYYTQDSFFRNQFDNAPARIPAKLPVSLFTPNTEQQPAVTRGQLENYRKDLEEEAKELEQARNRLTNSRSGFFNTDPIDNDRLKGGYVNVDLAQNGKYGYRF